MESITSVDLNDQKYAGAVEALTQMENLRFTTDHILWCAKVRRREYLVRLGKIKIRSRQ